MYLADDGNYRERRFFTSWKPSRGLEEYKLPEVLQKATSQSIAPIGFGVISTKETKIAAEICEELWTPESPHISQFLSGVEIISNASGSHHQLRKLDSRLSLIQSATRKCGGIYLYSNHRGCDGTRMYFDGSSLISLNGDILAQASQFSLSDVEVITAIIDLNDVRSYRQATNSLQEQASSSISPPIIHAKYFSLSEEKNQFLPLTMTVQPRLHTPEEECALGPACWLWDYLRRSNAGGYLLPLSGGADSASVATIVFIMCQLAVTAALSGDQQVMSDIERIIQRKITLSVDLSLTSNTDSTVVNHLIPSPEELCASILHTVYMGTLNSSQATRNRAANLASVLGAYHTAFNFDTVITALLSLFTQISGGRIPRFESQGGTPTEDIALQNIQARLRMVMAYLCAQLFPWLRGRKGFLLVLGSANVDESLRGYMTKYDCSSADINPIGGICKGDLKRMMLWAANEHKLSPLRDIVEAVPTVKLSFNIMISHYDKDILIY
jgi:NAD+ synthase (glutamine-hydrolysing)